MAYLPKNEVGTPKRPFGLEAGRLQVGMQFLDSILCTLFGSMGALGTQPTIPGKLDRVMCSWGGGGLF